MKCPKCGYHSFDHLESCKKCGQGLAEHKAKFNLRGFFFPGQVKGSEPEAVAVENFEEEESADEAVDFGFDFLDDQEDPVGGPAAGIALGDDEDAVSISQPFGVDSETVPADDFADGDGTDPDDKPGKGPEFAF